VPNAAPGPDDGIEQAALRLLATREHARLELTRKLAARGYGAADIAAVLTRLTALGALDEARFAQLYVAERARKGFGPVRIRAELYERGVADEIIISALHPMSNDWPVLIARAHDRRFGPDLPGEAADYGRRGRFLAGRGFPPELIHRFLRRGD
jgi:regulatory protein